MLRQPLGRFVDELAHAVLLDHAGVGDVVAVLAAHRHRRARADRADADDALRIEDRSGRQQRRVHPGTPDRAGFVLLNQADDGVDRLLVFGDVVIGRPLDGDDLVADLEAAALARLRRNGLDDAVALHELLDGEPHGRFLEEAEERGRAGQRKDAAELEGVFRLRELRGGRKPSAQHCAKHTCPNCAKRSCHVHLPWFRVARVVQNRSNSGAEYGERSWECQTTLGLTNSLMNTGFGSCLTARRRTPRFGISRRTPR